VPLGRYCIKKGGGAPVNCVSVGSCSCKKKKIAVEDYEKKNRDAREKFQIVSSSHLTLCT